MTKDCCEIDFDFCAFKIPYVSTNRQLAIFCYNLINVAKNIKQKDFVSKAIRNAYVLEAKSLWECNLKEDGFKWIDVKRGKI